MKAGEKSLGPEHFRTASRHAYLTPVDLEEQLATRAFFFYMYRVYLSLFWGKAHLLRGKAFLFWGKALLFWGKAPLFWGKALLLWGKAPLFWGKAARTS